MATKQKFGVGVLIAVTRTDALGVALAIPQPYRLGILQEVQADFSFTSKDLYGASQLPLDSGRGQAKLAFSAKTASIDAAALAALHFGIVPTVGLKLPLIDWAGTIPGSIAYTLTPVIPGSGAWVEDLGVSDTSGIAFTRVATPSAAGQYSVSAGVYTFSSADASRAVLISSEYSASTGGIVVPMTNQLMGYSPSFQVILYNNSKGSVLAVKLTNCQSDKLSMPFKNEDFTVADFGWTALDDGTGSAGYWCQA